MDLQKIFGKFAGKEVNVTEKQVKIDLPKLGIKQTVTECNMDENQQVLKDLYNTAAKHGLIVRTHLPGWASTCDYIETRLNVNIAKEADGKYRIQKDFGIG